MVGPLPGRQARYRLPLNAAPQEDRAQAEHRRASLGYLFWPAALYEQFAQREPASSWYRTQTKQAVQFGNRWALIAFGALLWPLLVSFFANPTVTIVIYFLALALDAVLLVVWLRSALRYSRMASRGETFSL